MCCWKIELLTIKSGQKYVLTVSLVIKSMHHNMVDGFTFDFKSAVWCYFVLLRYIYRSYLAWILGWLKSLQYFQYYHTITRFVGVLNIYRVKIGTGFQFSRWQRIECMCHCNFSEIKLRLPLKMQLATNLLLIWFESFDFGAQIDISEHIFSAVW